MKPLLLLGVLFSATSAPVHAADTAYAALRVFGKKEGEQSLYRVVELRGKGGTPQPSSWKLTIDDPRARGGVRELEVRGGKIVGERTPVARDFGPQMNFNQLNLDSDGAFTVANQEAEKRGVPFDHIDYTLRAGSGGGAPLWTIELYEGRNGRVGMLRVAADSGAIVEQNFNPERRFAGDHDYVENDRRRGGDRPEYREDHGDRDVGDEIGSFMNRIGRHFQKRGRQLSNFFTGKDGDR
jgi:hypothetical protein